MCHYGNMCGNGIDIRNNIENAYYYHEKASKLGNVYSMFQLAEIYTMHAFSQRDVDLSMHYYHKVYMKGFKKPEISMMILVKSHKLLWKPEYLRFWPYRDTLEMQILCLFCISKCRKESDISSVKYFTKDI